MRLLLDANVLLDSLVLESSGLPRPGKAASEQVIMLCDSGVHQGMVAWHTLPILAYYHERQHSSEDTAVMMDTLLEMVDVPTVGHREAMMWRSHGISDFEDSLQMAAAIAGAADVFITRNISDFGGSSLPVMTPEAFLAAYSQPGLMAD